MRNYCKTYELGYALSDPTNIVEETTWRDLDYPGERVALRLAARALFHAGVLIAVADGPLPFGDVVAIVFFAAAGALLLTYGILGIIQEMEL